MLWYIIVNNEFMRGVPGVEKFNPSILDVVIVTKATSIAMPFYIKDAREIHCKN